MTASCIWLWFLTCWIVCVCACHHDASHNLIWVYCFQLGHIARAAECVSKSVESQQPYHELPLLSLLCCLCSGLGFQQW